MESVYSELYCCCTYCWSLNHIWTFQPLKTINLCRTCAIHLELPLCGGADDPDDHKLCGTCDTCLQYNMLRWLLCANTKFGVPLSAVFLKFYIIYDEMCT